MYINKKPYHHVETVEMKLLIHVARYCLYDCIESDNLRQLKKIPYYFNKMGSLIRWDYLIDMDDD